MWAFVGDGETDEPETLGAISLAGREKLDNLIWVINCNLQRLDGPVRGNGKIIQELERVFNGAGWNVIKVIWGSGWDRTCCATTTPAGSCSLMNETVDGDYQTYKSRDGEYVRDQFFGRYPETRGARRRLDATIDIWALDARRPRSAQGVRRVQGRVEHTGEPTVILAKTIKGYGMGEAGEGMNIAHQARRSWTSKINARVSRSFLDSDLGRRDREESRSIRPPRRQPRDEVPARA